MPTAARRQKQRLARAKAQDIASDAATVQRVSVSTQTELNPHAIREMIEKWWRWIDSHGVDQAECEMQFIIRMQSRFLVKSMADLDQNGALSDSTRGEQQRVDAEQEEELAYLYDDEELYAAEYGSNPDDDIDYYLDSEYTPGDDEDKGAEHGRDNAEPLAICCGYEPCMVDRGPTSLSVTNTPVGLTFIDLEGMDWMQKTCPESWLVGFRHGQSLAH